MKNLVPLPVLALSLWALIALTGCYTQLVTYDRVSVMSLEPGRPYVDYDSGDTLRAETEPADTVVHEHYWADPWAGPWVGYPPYYDPGFHVGFSFYLGDPFWYPWCYRPYWSHRWYGWRYGYTPYGWDPFWYDPFYTYGGYYTGFWYPYWGWVGPYTIYDDDPVPRKKRDWDRRAEGPLDHSTRTRSSGTVEKKVPGTESTQGTRQGGVDRVERGIVRTLPGSGDSRRSSSPRVSRRSPGGGKSHSTTTSVTRSRPSVSRSSGHRTSGRSRSGSSHRSPGSRSRSGN
ncbi:MAG: hypothetical protein ACE5HZ_04885 [Fidelibacterota bacterium]